MMMFIFLLASFFQPAPLTVVSPDFVNEGMIPVRFTCDGDDINPTLIIHGIPEGTKSLVLIVEDPEAPLAAFTQWIVWNITPTHTILENTIPGSEGLNTVGKTYYRGPCPQGDAQRYAFKVYALNSMLTLGDNPKRAQVEEAMKGRTLAFGQLQGVYYRTVAISENGN